MMQSQYLREEKKSAMQFHFPPVEKDALLSGTQTHFED